MGMSSDEDELPTVDTIYARINSNKRKKLKEVEIKTTTTPKNVNNNYDLSTSAERHRILASTLFSSPPSNPMNPTSTIPSTSTECKRSPSIISDSEPEDFLPSSSPAVNRNGLTFENLGSSSTRSIARHSSVDSLLAHDSEEETFDQMRLIGRSVCNLSEDDAGDFGFESLAITDRTPKAPIASTSTLTPRIKSSTATKRTIAISNTISSDSDSSFSDSSSVTPLTPSTRPSRRLSSPRKAKSIAVISIASNIECICLSSDEEDLVVSKIATVGKKVSSVEALDFSDDDGVLIYEPTPRRKNPVKMTPNRNTLKPPKTPLTSSKRIEKIDLTASSDSDDDISTYVPPIKPRAKPLFKPSLVLPTTPKLSTPNSKSTLKILTPYERETLPIALIRELDREVFRKEFKGLKVIGDNGIGLPDGIEIKWNKRLLNTAGRATIKSITKGGIETHQTSIELSIKVTDNVEKLRHTLSHELCHLASWSISKEMKPSHGPAFKLWAARVMNIRKDIKISTTHSYEIVYSHRWQCLSPTCEKIYERHSASINVETHGCSCGSKLVKIGKDGKVSKPVVKTAYQEFLTAMGPRVRIENPGLNFGEVNKIIATMWSEAKNLAVASESMKSSELLANEEDVVKRMSALVVE